MRRAPDRSPIRPRPPIEQANKMAEKGEPVVIVIDPERLLSWGR
ncbi:MAG: hypothetical protein ABIZ34_00050 [Candidatus Limnocylindrales bacterium]